MRLYPGRRAVAPGFSRFAKMRMGLARSAAFRALLVVIMALLHGSGEAAAPKVIKIGVLADQDSRRALDEWNPTAAYLTGQVAGYRFEIVPYTAANIAEAVGRNEVGFILVNPETYVEMELAHGASRLVTMKRKAGGRAHTLFGGVIFCRADREDLAVVDGLAGKRFAAEDKTSFGGWIAALNEFQRMGLNTNRFFREVSFKGSGEAVVKAVLDGTADAGTVRTGTLERMAKTGEIELAWIRIINQQTEDAGFPLLHSTALYPEWVVAKLRRIPSELAEQVAVALMTMPHDHPAALAAGNAGWTIPENYHSVVDVLTELKIGPLGAMGAITFNDVMHTYWRQALIVVWIVVILFGVAVYIYTLNRRLGESRKGLMAELAERRLAEQKLRNITEMLGEGVYVLDEKGNLQFMNPEAERILGWKEDELLGKNMHDAIHHTRPDGAPFPAEDCPANRALLSGDTCRIEEDLFFRKDGAGFPAAFVTTPLRRDGGVVGAVSIFRDVTVEKKATAELMKSKNMAVEATLLKDKFVSLVAHDLKTPFANIIGYLKMLHKDTAARLEPRHRNMLEKALASSENLVYMIEGLLDISRLQTGNITVIKTPVDARAMAAAALEKFAALADEKGIALANDIPGGTVLQADSQLYSRVLQNLVSNAVKFCRRGDTIRIHLVDTMPHTVAVADTGVGVPAGILPDVFKHGEKTTTTGTAGETGTGLGLPFSADIMKAHGGTLTVESESGKGSVFRVTLPPA